MEFPERALIQSKELVLLLRLGSFKLTKFVSNVPDLADENDGSLHCTEPNIIHKEESIHVLGSNSNHNKNSLVVSKGTESNIRKISTQRLVLSLVSRVYHLIGLVARFSVVVCSCSFSHERHSVCQRTKLG